MIIEDKELKSLNAYIPQLLKSDLYRNRNFQCCPHCGSIRFIRSGYYNGIQRYKCHDCRKTFSKTTNSLWYYSKKKSNLWIQFTELFLEKQPLRKCAEILDVNLSTAFFWRHKIMSALQSNKNTVDYTKRKNRSTKKSQGKEYSNPDENNLEIINPHILRGDVFITYSYFQESSCNSIINFKMDFYRQEKRIYVVAARGIDDSMVIMPISRHHVFLDKFKNKVYERINKKSYMILYKADNLYYIAKNHNKRLSRKNKSEESRIREFDKNASEWFGPFHGIATKYLENYMGYFVLYNLDKCFKVMEFTYMLIRKINFIKSHNIKFMELSV
ncbi:MAG: hypothetical protein Q4F66_08210 [Clostridium sp.]|nr:hypothetical protein [Clostridium sp.]